MCIRDSRVGSSKVEAALGEGKLKAAGAAGEVR